MLRFDRRGLQLLIKSQTWGPLLVGAGLVFLSTMARSENPLILWASASLAVILVIGGLLIMFIQLWPRTLEPLDAPDAKASIEGLGRLVRQLTRNYSLLRQQTTQSLLITLILMAIGVIVILVGVFGAMFGFATDTKAIAGVAGTVMEMIGGSVLVVYRLNFKRLNDVTDRLEENWRILSAYTLVGLLPPDKQADATIALIDALVRAPASA